MSNNTTKIFTLLASGATIVRAKGVGYIVVDANKKRRRRRIQKTPTKAKA